jgi:hypothetical protein
LQPLQKEKCKGKWLKTVSRSTHSMLSRILGGLVCVCQDTIPRNYKVETEAS